MNLIVGTAGHIDHGKTALVRVLTGTDTDRLPEEKKRGITVDLGFAEMKIGDTSIGFVDVPGHERFVKNMLAGATGIDLVLLVIAADEGVMPQTREHFDICRLLGLKAGIIVLTKTDLADVETLELARLDAAELTAGSFLERAPIVEVSVKNGIGLENLKEALGSAMKVNDGGNAQAANAARLAIDRSFSVKGFGAVVTGTLAADSVAEGDEIELLPARRRLRVRGVQSHGLPVRGAAAGSRAALNLAGIDRSELARGMTVASPGIFELTQIVDAHVEMLDSSARPLKTRQRVRLHLGTAELLGRVYVLNADGVLPPGESDFVQFRLEAAAVAAAGDRFILRGYSPVATIGGGAVLDPQAAKHRKAELAAVRDHLNALFGARNDIAAQVRQFVEAVGRHGLNERQIAARTGLRPEAVRAAINENEAILTELGGRFLTTASASQLFAETKAALAEFHMANSIESGMPRTVLRNRLFARVPAEIFDGTLERLQRDGAIVQEKDLVRLSSHSTRLTREEEAFTDAIRRALIEAGLQPPTLIDLVSEAHAAGAPTAAAERKLVQMLIASGELVRVSDQFCFAKSAIDCLIAKLKEFAASSPGRAIDMAQFKDLAGVSRKYAIPLSEYLDRERVTFRRGDKRVII